MLCRGKPNPATALPPLEADDNEKPITSDVFRVDKGVKATAPYTYFEVKVIVEGVLIVSDAIGQKVRAVEEDVFYFPKAATITFEIEDGGMAFLVSGILAR
ncbi:unnamed protein product [Penicillium bialowiezense]